MRGIEDTSVLGVGLQSGVGQLGVGYLGVRGESLDTDGLSLDLQFATDKTLTARKGPTPLFTRASTGTFIGSNGLIQSAAVEAARFDHDPITRACRGLLIEESRANLQRNSAAFNLWTTTSTTVTADQTTAPDGTSTADTITETATTATHFIADVNAPVTSGNTYTLSVFAKKGAGATAPNLIQIAASAATIGNTKYATFNIQNGSVNSFSGGTASINAYPNGWYRLVFTVTAVTTGNTAMIVGFVGALPAQRLPSYLGAITSDVYLWGAQIEAGSFSTSYIPTGASALTRSADVCSITGSGFSGMWKSATEATILLKADASIMEATIGGNRAIASLANGAAYSNQIGFFKESGTDFIKGRTPIGSLIQVQNSLGKFKGAIAISSSAAGCFNGAAVSTNLDIIGTVDRLTFADPTLVAGGHPSVWVSTFQIYRKRLPNARLQSLTAP